MRRRIAVRRTLFRENGFRKPTLLSAFVIGLAMLPISSGVAIAAGAVKAAAHQLSTGR